MIDMIHRTTSTVVILAAVSLLCATVFCLEGRAAVSGEEPSTLTETISPQYLLGMETAGMSGDIWKTTLERVSGLKDFRCILNVFLIDTPKVVASGLADTQEKAVPGSADIPARVWYTIRMEFIWKSPGYSYMKILDMNTQGIDFATKHMKERPGTVLVFGYRDEKYIYGKFPLTGNPQLDEQISNNVFRTPVESYEAYRGGRSFGESMRTVAGRLSRYFATGTVILRREEAELKSALDYSEQEGTLSYESERSGGLRYRFIFVPEDPADNKGITKEVLWVDPTTYLPLQWEAYEGDRLVLNISAEKFEANSGVSDKLWEQFFENAVIGD